MYKSNLFKPLFLLLVLGPVWINAQSMALDVLGSSGGTSSSNGYSLHWTLGEAIVAGGSQGGDYLGAGFHQAHRKSTIVSIHEHFESTIQIRVYPNPSADFLNVKSEESKLTLRLCDVLGRPVVTDIPHDRFTTVSLLPLPAGVYILQVFNDQKQLVSTQPIQHIKL